MTIRIQWPRAAIYIERGKKNAVLRPPTCLVGSSKNINSPPSIPSERAGKDLMQGGLPTRTKVVIFEASEMACELMSRALERSIYGVEIVGCFTNAADIDAEVAQSSDVALISSNLKDGPQAGFEVLRSLQAYRNSLRCVMLVDRADPELVLETFRLGASGICERNDSCETLCKCIHRVHQGQVWANSSQVRILLQALGAESPRSKRYSRLHASLTMREEEIVTLVVEGKTNRDIAKSLNLSEHTIKNHLFRVFKKLGVSSRSELIVSSVHQKRSPLSLQ